MVVWDDSVKTAAVDWAATKEDIFGVHNLPTYAGTMMEIYESYFSSDPASPYVFSEIQHHLLHTHLFNYRSELGKAGIFWVSEEVKSMSPAERVVYVQSALKDCSFLYKDPKAMTGVYRSTLLLRVFAVHCRLVAKAELSYGDPIGALSLCAAAIERALKLWLTGIFQKEDGITRVGKPKASSFVETPWGSHAAAYLKGIRGLSAQKWAEIQTLAKGYLRGSAAAAAAALQSDYSSGTEGTDMDVRAAINISDDEPEEDSLFDGHGSDSV
ncbi:hypothetical protein C8F01DRAFT_1106540, partial [Mycena amicta]